MGPTTLRRIGNSTLILGSTLITIAALEIGCRQFGIEPMRRINSYFAADGWAREDNEIGWVNKPGSARLGSVTMTFNRDGSRVTGATGDADIIMIGCSFTQGHGVNDADTMAWRLHATHPRIAISNFAVAGYGTLQSYLELKRILDRDPAPKLVIYNFFYWHTIRDIAPVQWVRLFRDPSGRFLAPPRTMPVDGKLVDRPTTKYRRWPLEDQSSLVSLAKLAYLGWHHPSSIDRNADILVATGLLNRMQKLVAAHHSRLLVTVLDPWWPNESDPHVREWIPIFHPARDAAPAIRQFLLESARRGELEFLECAKPGETLATPDYEIPGGHHPNARANAAWAACIDQWLSTRTDL
jgi:hypothetical protein